MEGGRSEEDERIALAWIDNLVGAKMLAYILNCDRSTIQRHLSGEAPLSVKHREIIAAIRQFHESLPHDSENQQHREVLGGWLTLGRVHDRSRARAIRAHAGGEDVQLTPKDEAQRLLIIIASDVFPAFLLPSDIPGDLASRPFARELSIRVVQAIFQHPEAQAFLEAFLLSAELHGKFRHEEKHLGPVAMIYHNMGGGETLQLSMLLNMLLESAWRHMDDTDSISPERFTLQAVKELQLVRALLAGKPRSVTARYAFTGVSLPPDSRLEIPNGVVRPANENDNRFAPPTLTGQITTTDEFGHNTLVDYRGNVVLEYRYPYRIRLSSYDEEDMESFPDDLHPPVEIEPAIIRLRFGLMLAVKRDYRAQLIPTWRSVDRPLSTGVDVSWSDPRHGALFTPVTLTDVEVSAWHTWYERLSAPSVNRIELALSRVLRAIAERRDPSDVLIDSVIAWENLFGTKEGEPTFRITMSLAMLLKISPSEREDFRSELVAIYGIRSRLVHGNGTLTADDYPKCQRALDVAIEAIRTLVSERTDILELVDGGRRSTALLLGLS
ncbi:hypothetical protein E1292_13830 [Nonomuraea deserti]|uniref:Uncharacterized protein n=1 Tax=Nonomuraea deserti TaxID=1848322 RepID=A0A4R4VPN7_9ACTN|nr:HEPN domain-containing protein [Nonomuraea deserti]TDD07121.1 hypothetical protein E1292_13830 [Nonomuraea deserti]